MEVRLIIIGMNPSSSKCTKKSALIRLYSWLDKLDIDYVSFTNLSADPKWNFDLKHIDKKYLEDQLLGYTKIIALGGLVSSYLKKYIKVDHFKMPHPSYRNRMLNDANYENRQLLMCKDYIND